jgi:hypothetical protein
MRTEDSDRMPAATERCIDDTTSRHGCEHVDDLVQHHGLVSVVGVEVDTRGHGEFAAHLAGVTDVDCRTSAAPQSAIAAGMSPRIGEMEAGGVGAIHLAD